MGATYLFRFISNMMEFSTPLLYIVEDNINYNNDKIIKIENRFMTHTEISHFKYLIKFGKNKFSFTFK